MASHVFVVDSSFKRTQVKTTPGKYLREILEEACKSRKLSPEEYTLKTQNNKALDLSQPFRLSGLSAGAKLQLTQASKSPGVVSVALQLSDSEGGQRLNDKFPSNTSLWLVLRKYEDAVAGSSSKQLNLTQRGTPTSSQGQGRLVYEQPCLHLVGRNLETFAELQKTFAQLGLNGGSVLIKLSYKKTDTPLEEAMKEISDFFSSIDTVPAGIGSSASQGRDGPPNGAMESVPDASAANAAVPLEDEAKPEPNEDIPTTDGPTAQPVENDVVASSSQTEPQPQPPTPESTQPPTTINNISVYRPPTSSTPAAALLADDPSVFEPSIDHARSHQANLQQSGKNTRLLSDKELASLEASRQANLATIQNILIRVRYPDQSQIETSIPASETAADLYAKVMETLAAAPEPFELRYTGAKGHETLPNSASKRLVRDLGFKGRVLVTLVWSPDASALALRGPSLKEEYRRLAKELKVELASQRVLGEEAHRSAMAKPEAKTEGGKGGGGLDVEAKMKRFLGFAKRG